MHVDDPYAGLLKNGVVIDLPDPRRLRALGHLKQLGLLSLQERKYVHCVNPLDHDQRYRKDTHCDGRIWLEGHRREDELDYRCPDCDRVIFPSRKRVSEAMSVTVHIEALCAFLEVFLRSMGLSVSCRQPGWFRVLIEQIDVDIVLIDAPVPKRLLYREYGQWNPILYVVANDRDLAREIPADRASLRLVDLVQGSKAVLLPMLEALARAALEPPPVARIERAPSPRELPTAEVQVVGKFTDHSNTRALSREEYQLFVQGAQSFELFIDGIARPAKYSKRLLDGTVEAGSLTEAELRLLLGVITTPGFHRPKEFDRTLQDGVRCFEMARRKVDVELGRYQWRAFSTQRNNEDKSAKTYSFTPPAGLRICVLYP